MNTNGVFVTGTDTEVGKTVVAAALAAVLLERGSNPGVMKPVATGCRYIGGQLAGDDTLCLLESSGAADPMTLVTPYAYEPAVAPTVAAALAGREIELKAITEAYHQLTLNHDVMVVEGIGGIMVPLGRGTTVVDMACELGLPLIIVARSSLGTINHTLLTVHAAETAGLDVAAIVLNRFSPDAKDVVVRNNPHEIAERVSAPVVTLAEAEDVDIAQAQLGSAVDLIRHSPLMEIVENIVL